ncbi:MAG: tripartite tricarboxylate transporter TctB family protein [Rhodobacteraceae bacterium]|nr:tripartite tricarboxylate transporter TctB family protein [Paracoccaceae bacterium]
MTNGMHLKLADLIACGAIAVFGIAALMIGLDYQLGSLRSMGPGFFPVASAILVIVLSAATAYETYRAEPVARDVVWRPIIFVSLAIIVWTQLVDRAGFAPAMVALIFISSLAKSPFRPVSLLFMTVFLIVAGWAIFILGLGMPLTLFGR